MNLRNFVTGIGFLVLFAMAGFSQGKMDWKYTYVANFDTISTPHGITVDPAGNIWYGSFSDSVGIHAVQPNGEHLPFSPIFEVSVNGTVHNVAVNNRGMTTDHEGNILVSIGGKLVRVNYQDGSGMAAKDLGITLTKPAVDQAGNVYVGPVVGTVEPGQTPRPIWKLNSALEEIGVVTDSMMVWSRAMEVTPDGKSLYVGSLWHAAVQRYFSEDGETYALADSLPGPFLGHTNGLNFDREGRLWVCEFQDGRFNDNIYIYNLDTMTRETVTADPPNELWDPRGVAFSLSGDTVYIALSNGGLIQKWVRAPELSPLLDDFEGTEFVNHWGAPWQLTGGLAGTLDFEVVSPGYESDSALRIHGHYTNWAGVETLMNPDFEPVDISQFKAISFYVKSIEPDTLGIRLREKKAETARGYDFAKYTFAVTDEWQEIAINFEDFWPSYGGEIFDPPFDATDIIAIDWGGQRTYQNVDFMIDDIRFLTEVVSVDDPVVVDLPAGFTLYQNYPNPFNPATTIEFYLPETGHVTLEIYNMLGQRVGVLVDEFRQQGRHSVVWNARDQFGIELSSGVYFYRVISGEITDIKKMTLIR